jgi:hypothetical protein
MNILEIYKKYQIMPQLQEHQLRVAAVADAILDNLSLILERREIIAACLLHDMGNILKFDLTKSHIYLNKDIDIAFWQKVKDQYMEKYGPDEHIASMAIAKELGVSGRIMELINAVGFEVSVDDAYGADFGKKICEYADDRVDPFGVVGLEQRFWDLHKRYAHKHPEPENQKKREKFENSLRQIERQIFEHCKIKPEDITEAGIAERKERLKGFGIYPGTN